MRNVTRASVRAALAASLPLVALAAPVPAAAAQGSTMAQDDWVQTSAISWSGGIRPATGSVRAGTRTPAAGGEHEVEYSIEAGQSPPPSGPGSLSGTGKPGTAKEIDRASAKLAQFAINGNSPGPCRVGTRYPALRLDDGRNRWQLSDVAVVRCGGGKMTVRYGSRQAR